MLPYSTEALFALYTHYLLEQRAVALPLFLVTLALPWLATRAADRGGRLAALVLACGWLWVGAAFHFGYFATVNFAAPVYGGLFLTQGVLLLWSGTLRDRLGPACRSPVRRRIGIATLVSAAVLYPLLDLAAYGGGGLRLAALAPTPTALFTIGLLLTRERAPRALFAIPLLWTGVAVYHGWVLALPADLFALPVAVTALIGASIDSRRAHA